MIQNRPIEKLTEQTDESCIEKGRIIGVNLIECLSKNCLYQLNFGYTILCKNI